MSSGFSWWGALETFLAVGTGALVSFLSITALEKRKRSGVVELERKRFFLELSVLRETLVRDYKNIVDSEDIMGRTQGIIISPGFSDYDFRALDDSFYHASEKLNSNQREFYTRMIADAKYIKSQKRNSEQRGVISLENLESEFEERLSEAQNYMSEMQLTIALIISRLDALVEDREEKMDLESMLNKLYTEVKENAAT